MKRNIEEIVKVLTDNYAIMILTASYQKEKNAIELSQELDIPIAACYRRLSVLRKFGFIDMNEKVTFNGKKTAYYRSRIKKVAIQIDDNRIVVEIFERNNRIKRYVEKIIKRYAR